MDCESMDFTAWVRVTVKSTTCVCHGKEKFVSGAVSLAPLNLLLEKSSDRWIRIMFSSGGEIKTSAVTGDHTIHRISPRGAGQSQD
jgi:hypothetical protein